MITLQVTSDSSLPDLRLARILLDELTARAEVNMFEEAKEFKPSHKTDITVKVNGTSTLEPRGIFNATELAEAETMGKSVCSTVAADPSTIAPVDTQVSISLPEPTSVFGQAAQTTANVASPAVQTTDYLAIDVNGFPWDSRIHSSSKEMVKDGTWRKRRGVADELVRQVEAELRGVYTAINVNAIDKLPPSMIDVTTIDKPPQTEFQPAAPDMTFTELLDGVTKAMVAGQLSQVTITEALKSVGLEALPHLLGNPALIPAFREALGGVV